MSPKSDNFIEENPLYFFGFSLFENCAVALWYLVSSDPSVPTDQILKGNCTLFKFIRFNLLKVCSCPLVSGQ